MFAVDTADLFVFADGALELLRGVVGLADLVLPVGGIIGIRIAFRECAEDIGGIVKVTDGFFGHFSVHAYLHPAEFKVGGGEVVECRFGVFPQVCGCGEESLIDVIHKRGERREAASQILVQFDSDTNRVVDLSGLEE